jgi:hypothetical protein
MIFENIEINEIGVQLSVLFADSFLSKGFIFKISVLSDRLVRKVNGLIKNI